MAHLCRCAGSVEYGIFSKQLTEDVPGSEFDIYAVCVSLVVCVYDRGRSTGKEPSCVEFSTAS
jgi:hypothetical protein